MTGTISTYRIFQNAVGYLAVEESGSLADTQRWLTSDASWQIVHMGFAPLGMEDSIRVKTNFPRGTLICSAIESMLRIGDGGNGLTPLQASAYIKCPTEPFFVLRSSVGVSPLNQEATSGPQSPASIPAEPAPGDGVRVLDPHQTRKPTGYALGADIEAYLRKNPDDAPILKEMGVRCAADAWTATWEDSALYERVKNFLVSFAKVHYWPYLKEIRKMKVADAVFSYLFVLPAFELQFLPVYSTRLENGLRAHGINHLCDLVGNEEFFFRQKHSLGRSSYLELLNTLLKLKVGSPSFPCNQGVPVGERLNKPVLDRAKALEKLEQIDQPAIQWTPIPATDALGDVLYVFFENLAKAYPAFGKLCEIAQYRLSGITLEEIGQSFDVTRERVRQLEAKLFRRVKACFEGLGFDNPVVSGVCGWLKNFQDVLAQEGEWSDAKKVLSLLNDSQHLACRAHSKTYVDFFLGLIDVQVDILADPLTGKSLYVPVKRGFKQTKVVADAKKHFVRPRAKQMAVYDQYSALKAVRSFISKQGAGWVASILLTDEFIAKNSLTTSDGKVVFAKRKGNHHGTYAELVLMSTEMGVIDLKAEGLEVVQKRTGKDWPLNQINSLIAYERSKMNQKSDKFLYSLGKSCYAVWGAFGVTDEQLAKIVVACHDLLLASPEREFSDSELYEHIQRLGLATWGLPSASMNKHVVTAALQRAGHPQIRYLGRYLWSYGKPIASKPSKHRKKINDLICEFIQKMGRPVTHAEAGEYLSSVRGVGGVFQVIVKGTLVEVESQRGARTYWDSRLGEIPQNKAA